MRFLRGLYMIIGWIVMLPIMPIVMFLSFITLKVRGLKVKEIMVFLWKQLIHGIKQNIDFVINGL